MVFRPGARLTTRIKDAEWTQVDYTRLFGMQDCLDQGILFHCGLRRHLVTHCFGFPYPRGNRYRKPHHKSKSSETGEMTSHRSGRNRGTSATTEPTCDNRTSTSYLVMKLECFFEHCTRAILSYFLINAINVALIEPVLISQREGVAFLSLHCFYVQYESCSSNNF